MGFFKGMRDLKRMGEEMEATMPPPGQRLAEAQARMAGLSQQLATQTQQANAAMTAAATGVGMTATITGARQLGTVNFDLLMELDLTVLPSGLPPYPATAQVTISQLQVAQVRQGATVRVKVTPGNPAAVWVDPASIS